MEPEQPNIDSCLLRIANVISLYAFDIPEKGLLNGKTGASIFLYKYAEYSKELFFSEVAKELIDEVGKSININPTYDFIKGLTGIGWGFNYLLKQGFNDPQPYVETIENLINAEAFKGLLLVKAKFDLYGYGLYYSQKQNQSDSRSEILKSTMINQMITHVIADCERILSKKQILGNPVPKFSLYQLNLILYFIDTIKEFDFDSYQRLMISALNYYSKMQNKACDNVDFSLFHTFKERFSSLSNEKIIEKLKDLRDDDNLEVLSSFDSFSKSYLYKMLYCEDLESNLNIKKTDIAMKISKDEKYCEAILTNLKVEQLGIQNGIAGIGLALLDSMNY